MTLAVLCEGETEMRFVAQVLRPHLARRRVFAEPELLWPKGGGVVPFELLRSVLKKRVGTARTSQAFTTMIDLYRIGAYPGAERLPGEAAVTRVARIETAMREQLPSPSFLPHLQLHEFEALLYVDLEQVAGVVPGGRAQRAMAELRREVEGLAPEEIDDGLESAPSKRLIRHLPRYAAVKSVAGPLVAQRIGLERLRQACPHFGEWMQRMEQLAA